MPWISLNKAGSKISEKKGWKILDLKQGEIAFLPTHEKFILTDYKIRGSTILERGALSHGGWISPARGVAYVLDKEGYIKIDRSGKTSWRHSEVDDILMGHLHSQPHVIVEKHGEQWIIKNIGHEPLILCRL